MRGGIEEGTYYFKMFNSEFNLVIGFINVRFDLVQPFALLRNQVCQILEGALELNSILLIVVSLNE